MGVIKTPVTASRVEPGSIKTRAPCGSEAELLVRQRPPGQVNLPRGQREHMLLSSVGSPMPGRDVRSVLETSDDRYEWDSCPQGHVTFVPAGFPMRWDWSYRSDSIHLTMLPAFMDTVRDAMRADGPDPSLGPMFRVMDGELSGLLRQLRIEATRGELGKDLVTSSLLTLIAIRVHRLNARETPGKSANAGRGAFSLASQQRCIELLNDRLDEKIPLKELAAEFGLSPFRFCRQFKKATGFPPHEFQLQLRIARARTLLAAEPKRSIAEIACELGFADESHLRRHFKRIVGMTPGRYRRRQ